MHAAGGLEAHAATSKFVVVISTHEPGTRPAATLIKGLREGLASAAGAKIDIMVEHLDRYAPAPANDPTLSDMLAQKYKGRVPDLVIALGGVAIDFANRIRSRMWKDVPIVFSDGAHILDKITKVKNITGVIEALEMDRTLHNALQLYPGTKRIVVVNGASIVERALQTGFEQTVRKLGREIEVESLAGLTYEQVGERLAALDAESIVYFLSFYSDGSERGFVPAEALQGLAGGARRPVFANGAGYLGQGILGGWFVDYGQLGREVSAQALRILDGEPASRMPIERSASIRPIFDWRQMQRWGVPDDALPAGSIVLYAQASLWQQYRTWIVSALVAFTLQATLIGTLLWERGRRRLAEARALTLSGQVIEATENERGRIARELHDDISQRLALLSIEIDQFANRAKTEPTALLGSVKHLSGKTQAIAEDVHQLAKELHPTSLKMLGLAKAVRMFSAELEARHEIAIALNERTNLRDLPESVAISIYRVVQEALQNVVKHSGAREASITFTGAPDSVTVLVADDGRGFDVAHIRGGIGLDSMRERLRLVGGKLKVESRPGSGTRVEATIPMTRAA